MNDPLLKFTFYFIQALHVKLWIKTAKSLYLGSKHLPSRKSSLIWKPLRFFETPSILKQSELILNLRCTNSERQLLIEAINYSDIRVPYQIHTISFVLQKFLEIENRLNSRVTRDSITFKASHGMSYLKQKFKIPYNEDVPREAFIIKNRNYIYLFPNQTNKREMKVKSEDEEKNKKIQNGNERN